VKKKSSYLENRNPLNQILNNRVILKKKWASMFGLVNIGTIIIINNIINLKKKKQPTVLLIVK